MAVRQVNLHKTYTFVWSKDPDFDPKGNHKDGATKFFYRALDAYESAYLKDRITTIEKMPMGIDISKIDVANPEHIQKLMSQTKTRAEAHKIAVEAVRICCTGFENYMGEDAEGKDVPVEFHQEHDNIGGKAKLVLASTIAAALDADMCMEWYMQIQKLNTVTKSMEKNSARAS